jgi:hypothetical protein
MHRLAAAASDLKALEKVREKEKQELEAGNKNWESERQALNALVQELAKGRGTGPPKALQMVGNAPQSVQMFGRSESGERGLHNSLATKRDSSMGGLDEDAGNLRKKLVQMQCDSDRYLRHAAEVDEQAYDWFVTTSESSVSTREGLAAEVALLRAHIASRDLGGKNGAKFEALVRNVGIYADTAFSRWRLVRIMDAWSRFSGSCKMLRDGFSHLLRGVGNSESKAVLRSLSERIRENASFDNFKVVSGRLMLRAIHGSPCRGRFRAWAYTTFRNKMLWRHSSRLAFAKITIKMRQVIVVWRRLPVIRRWHVEVARRRTDVRSFRYLQWGFQVWAHEFWGASKLFLVRRRILRSHRRRALRRFIALWLGRMRNLKSLKHNWASLKTARTYRALARAYNGWIVMTSRKARALFRQQSLIPAVVRSSDASDPMLAGGRLWQVESTVQLGKLQLYRYYCLQLLRHEHLCTKKARNWSVLRCLRAWSGLSQHIALIKWFSRARQRRESCHRYAVSFGAWVLQHPRRTNLVRFKAGVQAQHLEAPPLIQNHGDSDVQATPKRHATSADEALDVRSPDFLQLLMPMKSLHGLEPASPDGTQRMFFVWKTVVTHFESRIQHSRNTKRCRRVFECWLQYQIDKKDLFRKQALFMLRWSQTPLLVVLTRWKALSRECYRRKNSLIKFAERKRTASQLEILWFWKQFHLLHLKSAHVKSVVQGFCKRIRRSVLQFVLSQWWLKVDRRKVLLFAEQRIVKRTNRYSMQKAFLHFAAEINVDVNAHLRSWPRSLVMQAYMENFKYGVVEKGMCQPYSDFFLNRIFNFWAELTRQRLAIIKRCNHAVYTWPLQCTFRTWARFVLIKHKIVDGLGQSHTRHVRKVLELCYVVIKEWSWFTRVRKHVQKHLKSQIRRMTRYTLRPLFCFWSIYTDVCRSFARRKANFAHRAAIRQHRRVQKVVNFWRAYTNWREEFEAKSAAILRMSNAKNSKRMRFKVFEWWRIFAGTRSGFDVKCATVMHMSEAKNTGRLRRKAFEWWRIFAGTRSGFEVKCATVMHMSEAKNTGRLRRKAFEWWRVYDGSRRNIIAQANIVAQRCRKRRAYTIWSIYATRKAGLARKGMIVVHRREFSSLARGFDGFRHRMVTIEIASQFQSCIKDLQVGSLTGNAFRSWFNYKHLDSFDNAKQAAFAKKRLLAFLTRFLCRTVIRKWKRHIDDLTMNVNIRIVRLEEDMLRYVRISGCSALETAR